MAPITIGRDTSAAPERGTAGPPSRVPTRSLLGKTRYSEDTRISSARDPKDPGSGPSSTRIGGSASSARGPANPAGGPATAAGEPARRAGDRRPEDSFEDRVGDLALA